MTRSRRLHFSPASKLVIAAACVLNGLGMTALADLKLPRLFSDHMVLPSGVPVPLWGWADPGATVTVSGRDATATVQANAGGEWRVILPPLPAGGPFEVEISVVGKDAIIIRDVLAGEVWLGSGQSNLTMPMERASGFEAEKAAARHPEIRIFRVAGTASFSPKKDFGGRWVVCSPEAVGAFPAMLYHFGKELHERLKTPVGVVCAGIGGTGIELWIDARKQEETPALRPVLDRLRAQAAAFDPVAAQSAYQEAQATWEVAASSARTAGLPEPPRPRNLPAIHHRNTTPGGLYNALIAPLVTFPFRGVIWAQGESNTKPDEAPFYEAQLRLMVSDWREKWGRADLPFVWVQLANIAENRNDWSAVREAQRRALTLPHTGMVSAIDLGGTPPDVHYVNKKEIGHRLALWALRRIHGYGSEVSGPLPLACRLNGTRQLVVTWDHATGLTARGETIAGFEISGPDGIWHAATAQIVGEEVILTTSHVPEPRRVRYGWANNPGINLYNAAGLPASPFQLAVAPAL